MTRDYDNDRRYRRRTAWRNAKEQLGGILGERMQALERTGLGCPREQLNQILRYFLSLSPEQQRAVIHNGSHDPRQCPQVLLDVAGDLWEFRPHAGRHVYQGAERTVWLDEDSRTINVTARTDPELLGVFVCELIADQFGAAPGKAAA